LSDIPGKTENCISAEKKIQIREKFTALLKVLLKIKLKKINCMVYGGILMMYTSDISSLD